MANSTIFNDESKWIHMDKPLHFHFSYPSDTLFLENQYANIYYVSLAKLVIILVTRLAPPHAKNHSKINSFLLWMHFCTIISAK